MMKLVLAISSLLLGFSISNAATIDFEDFNTTGTCLLSISCFDAGPRLEFTNVDGSGIDVSIVGGASLFIYDMGSWGGNPAYSQGLIDYLPAPSQNTQGTTILFSAPVINFSLIAGDFSYDDDVFVGIEAFDSDGNFIEGMQASWAAYVTGRLEPPSITTDFKILSAFGETAGISSITYKSGGTRLNSTFIDDITFDPAPIPEPSTFLLLGGGLAGLAFYARRRRK